MKTQKVQFDGKAYDCRVVESNEGEELLIGSMPCNRVALKTRTKALPARKPEESMTESFFLPMRQPFSSATRN